MDKESSDKMRVPESFWFPSLAGDRRLASSGFRRAVVVAGGSLTAESVSPPSPKAMTTGPDREGKVPSKILEGGAADRLSTEFGTASANEPNAQP